MDTLFLLMHKVNELQKNMCVCLSVCRSNQRCCFLRKLIILFHVRNAHIVRLL
jgi:hypothetical protein